MKGTIVVLSLLVAGTAAAQPPAPAATQPPAAEAAAPQPPTAPAPAPHTPATTTAVPAAPQAAERPKLSLDQRQQQVRMMEGVLAVAVRTGAETLARRLQIAQPGSLIVTAPARARGFALDGYGVFFDVDVPQMRQSVAWSTMMLLREQRRRLLQQQLASNPDPATRRRLELELRNLDGQGAPVQALPSADAPVAAGASPVSAQGTVSAQTVPDSVPAFIDTSDPNEQYTEAIKSALIDAMLNYGGPMNLGPDEWLTIAARDSEGPLMPGAVDDASTIVLRVKGSDIAAFLAKKITADEARQRVQVREF